VARLSKNKWWTADGVLARFSPVNQAWLVTSYDPAWPSEVIHRAPVLAAIPDSEFQEVAAGRMSLDLYLPNRKGSSPSKRSRPAPGHEAFNADRVVTLNMGLGRDSITMLVLALEGALVPGGELEIGPDGKGRLRPGGTRPIGLDEIDVVVFSDTVAEWPHTMALIDEVREATEEGGGRFIVLSKGPKQKGCTAEQAKAWQPTTWAGIEEKAALGCYHLYPEILGDRTSRETVVEIGGASCTDQHKIAPMKKLREDIARVRFGVEDNTAWGNLHAGSSDWRRKAERYESLLRSKSEQRAALSKPSKWMRKQERIAFASDAGLGAADTKSFVDGADKWISKGDRLGRYASLLLPALLVRTRERLRDAEQRTQQAKAVERPRHIALLGIAADETSRLNVKRSKGKSEDEYQKKIEKFNKGTNYDDERYPLVAMGIAKTEEEPILKRRCFQHVTKSGCFICPYQPASYWAALSIRHPKLYKRVLAYERKALARNPKMAATGYRWRASGRHKAPAGVKPGSAMRIHDIVRVFLKDHPDPDVDAILRKDFSRDTCTARQQMKDEGESLEAAAGAVTSEVAEQMLKDAGLWRGDAPPPPSRGSRRRRLALLPEDIYASNRAGEPSLWFTAAPAWLDASYVKTVAPLDLGDGYDWRLVSASDPGRFCGEQLCDYFAEGHGAVRANGTRAAELGLPTLEELAGAPATPNPSFPLRATTEAAAKKEAVKISAENPDKYVVVVASFGLYAELRNRLGAQAPSDTPFDWYVLNGKVKRFTRAQELANQEATPQMS